MRGFVLAMAALVLLSGCARTLWYKDGVTQAEFRRDTYECEKDARQSQYFGSGLVGAMNMRDFYDRCLMARGYEKRRAQ